MTAQSSPAVALEPCPHCGGRSLAIADNEDKEWHANAWWVVCEAPDCGARGAAIHDNSEHWGKAADRTPEECTALAIAAWNRRAAPRAPAETGEVEELKADLKDEINFDLNTRINKVPESVVDQVVDLLAERGLLALAALPPSSGCSPSQSELHIAKEKAKDEAADFILGQLAKALGLESFTPADGSETWDGDVSGTVWAILRDAGVIDPETNERVASSGWEAGAEAMREKAARRVDDAILWDLAEIIRALPLPPPPSKEGAGA